MVAITIFRLEYKKQLGYYGFCCREAHMSRWKLFKGDFLRIHHGKSRTEILRIKIQRNENWKLSHKTEKKPFEQKLKEKSICRTKLKLKNMLGKQKTKNVDCKEKKHSSTFLLKKQKGNFSKTKYKI